MSVEIRNPCDQRWSDMAPRGEGRFCASCQRVVVNLSRLTRREAEARVARAEAAGDRLCRVLRLDARTGEPVFRPEPSRAAGWAGGLALAVALSSGCDAEPSRVDPAVQVPDAAPVDAAAPPLRDRDRGPLAAVLPPGPTLAPMTPEGPEPPAPRTPTRALTAEELDRPFDDPSPTEAQRALTARKRRARHHLPVVSSPTLVSDPGW